MFFDTVILLIRLSKIEALIEVFDNLMISSASVCLFVLSVLENDWGTCFLSCHILKALVNVFFLYIFVFLESGKVARKV